MQVRCADIHDVAVIKTLEKLAVSDEFSDIELRHGISGDFFDEQQLNTLIKQRAIWLIFDNQIALGYLVFARFEFHLKNPLYKQLQQRYQHDEVALDWRSLHVCGPVWLDNRARGTGAFKQLYDAAETEANGQVIALIADHNERSIKAHCQHAKMRIVDFQTLAGRDFYLLLAD
ncbi:hypothetical protein HR45_10325 [Shewanella mangrovi]|uniref:N-acetyltransferase domain-containing protein n=1 Tax=Shewanella mangrovi TaxID=1515746 RepID=A0A094JDX4_9GAMM|nr:hypothetical protein [Shewanella mangrovi]KFZ37407.1 hypothetical protein HR45_10325 [Shewanella mangrovi]